MEGRVLGAGREDERDGRRAVREQVGEDAENLRARRGSRLRLYPFTPLRGAAQRAHGCFDR